MTETNNMLKKLNIYFLFVAMIVMQSVSLAHAVEHQDHEHTEICEAYSSAEHATGIAPDAPPLVRVHFVQSKNHEQIHFVVSQLQSHYFARAPPVS